MRLRIRENVHNFAISMDQNVRFLSHENSTCDMRNETKVRACMLSGATAPDELERPIFLLRDY